MARRKKYQANMRKQRVFMFDGWLMDIERKAFGWRKTDDREETHYSIEDAKTRHYKFHCYWRVKPYSNNPLFVLTELISTILYFIRAIARYLVVPLVALGIVIWILGSTGCLTANEAEIGWQFAIGVLAVYVVGLIIPTLIIAGFGFLWRKVFRIDEKLDEKLDANGYAPAEDWDSDYDNDVEEWEDPHIKID